MQNQKVKESLRSIKLIRIETALTSFILFMPVTYLLLADIGLSQAQIGLTQTIFALTMLFLEVPTGYFADRVSRKMSNFSGDIFIAFAVLIYYFANSFWPIVLAEIIFGIGLSLTSGADSALLRAHAKIAGLSYKKLAARISTLSFIYSGIGAILGGLIGASSIRFVFLAQAVVFLIAGLFSFFIKDAGKNRITDKHPIQDVREIVRYCLRGHKVLAWRIILGASLTVSTYMIIWFLTPSFLKAGIDIKYHGLMFAAISIFAIAGSTVIEKGLEIKLTTAFLVSAIAYFALGVHIGLISIFLFLLTSFSRGINAATVIPYIQEEIPDDIQATAVSVYKMVYKLMAATLIALVNFIGNKNIQSGLLAAGLITLVFYVFFRFNSRKLDGVNSVV
jgi:MFS family permease